jgi:hypothetical protein
MSDARVEGVGKINPGLDIGRSARARPRALTLFLTSIPAITITVLRQN